MTSTSAPSPLRLLHLEDNPGDAELIRAQVQEAWPGCAIERVDTRDGFISALAQGGFDLILSDFSLPAFNGLEALALAREHSAATPFVFLSGTIGEDNAVLALQRGAVDYIIKDRPARLVPAIENALLRHREERQLREAERRLQEQAGWLDKARDAIGVTDLTGRFTYWNEAAARLFGWHRSATVERRLHELLNRTGSDRLAEAMRQLRDTGGWTGDIHVMTGDGSLRHLESRWTLMRSPEGRAESILLINTDITEQKNLESQLLRSQRLEGIGTLAGGIAHDLNNVLSPILMAVNLLQSDLADPEHRRLVGVLEKSAQHGAALVRQILAFARGAEGEFSEVHPHTVLKDVVSLLSETLPRSISIETDIPQNLRPIRANATHVSQVLLNLGVNARDAMPAGGRLVFQAANVVVDEALARAHAGAQAGPHVRIIVADTGTGIPPELLTRIFDPFFTTKAAGKGTGLGLATVLGIMKGHRGFLQVQSEPGHGTRFSLHFPVAAGSTATEETPVASLPRSQAGETILVIDDESAVGEIVSALLKAYGYRVTSFTDGREALALYEACPGGFHAVVTDMMMPGISGRELIRRLRALNPDVRIVAMSGITSELAALPRASGRLVTVDKPMTGPDLLHAIHSVLHVHPG